LDANHSSPSLILIPLGLCIIQGWNLLYMIIIPIQGIYIYIYIYRTLSIITPSLVDPSQTFHIYYGTASSAANYGCTVATPTRKLLLSTSMMSLMGGKNVRSPKLKRVPTELIIVSSTIQKRELKRST